MLTLLLLASMIVAKPQCCYGDQKAQYLELNVPGVLDISLQVHVRVAKGSISLLLSLLQQAHELSLLHGQTHTSATTTGSGLDHDGEAHLHPSFLTNAHPVPQVAGTPTILLPCSHLGLQ